MTDTPLLQLRQLQVQIAGEQGTLTVVDGVDLDLHAGRALGLVGESGSGKSMTCSAIINLLPTAGRISGGQILFKGRDLTGNSPRQWRQLRGRELGMILQNPMTSLNPLMTVGRQLAEVFRYGRRRLSRSRRRQGAIKVLEQVQLPAAESRLRAYPHQFSGGMRQRIAIAINLAGEPDLLIADEPTTALDVTIRQQILRLLKQVQKERRSSVLLVSHDLHAVARFCDDVAIMYAGRIVERGPVETVFHHPAHPYTQGLIAATPSIRQFRKRLQEIPGQPPRPGEIHNGCRFAPRCPRVTNLCRQSYPALRPAPADGALSSSGGRQVACWHPLEART